MTKAEAIHFAECLKNNQTINFSDIELFCEIAIKAIKQEESAKGCKTISYRDCSDAMLMMWMENILTDGEYNRIMDKLNKSEMCKRYMNGET